MLAATLCAIALVIALVDPTNASVLKDGVPTLQWDDYYSYDGIVEYLESLAQAYGDRVTLKDAGESYEGRKLKTMTITNGDGRTGKNVIFLDAAMHAREWITPSSALYVIEQLVVHRELNAHLLEDFDWIIMPLANPDGYEYSRNTNKYWRNTRSPNGNGCYGTNLNRNFDIRWSLGYPELLDPCEEHYAGSKPFSESEALAIRNVLSELVSSKRGIMYISLHSYNESILYPWVSDSAAVKNQQEHHEIAKYAADAIRSSTGSIFDPRQSHVSIGGTSLDYAYEIGIPLSFIFELSGRGYGFFPPWWDIKPLAEESWVGIQAMAEKVVEKYPLNSSKIESKKVNEKYKTSSSPILSAFSGAFYIMSIFIARVILM